MADFGTVDLAIAAYAITSLALFVLSFMEYREQNFVRSVAFCTASFFIATLAIRYINFYY